MSEIHKVTKESAERAWVDAAKYDEMYRQSIEDNEGFWVRAGRPG